MGEFKEKTQEKDPLLEVVLDALGKESAVLRRITEAAKAIEVRVRKEGGNIGDEDKEAVAEMNLALEESHREVIEAMDNWRKAHGFLT